MLGKWRMGPTLLLVVALRVAAQPTSTMVDQDGFLSLVKENNWTGWEGNGHAWKLERGILEGRSDGSSAAVLVVAGRDFGDFDLRFEALVHQGSVRVKMRGPGPGPLGVALEINSRIVEWFGNGTSVLAAVSNRPDEWSDYRVVVQKGQFKLWKNGMPSASDLAVSHLDPRASFPYICLRPILPRSRSAASASRNRYKLIGQWA